MIKNYFKIALRNLLANKSFSLINISGLAIGLAVAMLIGLWIWDEISFDKYHSNYNRIALVMENDSYNDGIHTGAAIPWPLDAEMRKNFGNDFKHIVMSSWTDKHVLAVGDKKITYPGNFIGAEAPEMFTLNMLRGSRRGLQGSSSMLISQSVSKALFGDMDPMNKLITLDNKANFKISGVYEDLPVNTSLHDIAFMVPWEFFAGNQDWIARDPHDWNNNSLFMYVQIADNADMKKLSEKIKNVKLNRIDQGNIKSKPLIFLQPMSNWHLYSQFKNGLNAGGAIEYVWLFGVIGIFVLLLACINFMNLSTARSEKRAKEVGIRKAIGSLRIQLIGQFLCESLMLALLSFCFAMLIVQCTLPFFNEVAGKRMNFPWSNSWFWLISLGFTTVTGLISGSYPAFYLSSFKPVKVLKGVFNAGRFAAIPRKVLVVTQFSVSIILIIGTIIVFRQIQFAKNRPIGYNREGLVNIETTNDDLYNHFDAMRTDMLRSGGIMEVAGSSSPATGINNDRNDLSWKGKDPTVTAEFGNIGVTAQYGKTVGWQFIDGRDFSGRFHDDSASLILNEAAVKYMGLKNPVGEIIRVGKRDLTVIGVVRDMVMGSPYEPAKQSIFHISYGGLDDVIIKIDPGSNIQDAISKIEAVCKTYSPAVPFSFKFVDEEYASKFTNQERIGKLSSLFAALAIFISSIGLFGMASFVAEQRIKEIGVRKVLGATVFNLWQLLSREFMIMVLISFLIATPAAYYFMHNWLQHFSYRTSISWWIFGAACASAFVISLLTVSFQTIRAALSDPVKSLRTE
jgi:putative ABC transport system permease protein